ncbi:hypothetical protein [Algihabitans albus]|uniref:hypothetical protein n=1 Tax=Algihabitans albus TaxID=2164067 RepID=UPI000E5DA487|nr:hypothetical protein [Algihabitans albus]
MEQEKLAAEVERLQARVESLEYALVALLEQGSVSEEWISDFVKANNSPYSHPTEISGGGAQLLSRMRNLKRAIAEATEDEVS